MKIEGEHVDQDGNDDQADHASHHMLCEVDLGHVQVTKLVPQVFCRVKTDQGRGEESNPFDATHASDAESAQEQPGEPFDRETLVSQAVEPCPTEDGGEGKAKEHRVEEDEA